MCSKERSFLLWRTGAEGERKGGRGGEGWVGKDNVDA